MPENKNPPTAQGPKVTWQVKNDGLKPVAAPFGYVLRNPLVRAIPPKAKIVIDLQIAASLPLVVWPRGDMREYATTPQFVAPGQTVTITIENRSERASLVIESKEAIVNVHPLAWNGTDEVG